MKKVAAFILICLLTANICGASISYHFCGKIFQYFAFNGHTKKSHCCCKGTQKKIGCCKTKHCKVNIDDNKSLAKQVAFNKFLDNDALVPEYSRVILQFLEFKSVVHVIFSINTPPLVRTISLHVLCRQFLI